MPVVHAIEPAFDFANVARIYSDGGVMGPNPSERGGTWAFCYVDHADNMIQGWGGVVLPGEIGMGAVTNNLTELLALLLAIEPLPEGWSGGLFTDSLVTLRRFTEGCTAYSGIPDFLKDRVKLARDRLGSHTITLLGGHPSQADLARGHRSDGYPVSKHNRYCDRRCNQARADFTARQMK